MISSSMKKCLLASFLASGICMVAHAAVYVTGAGSSFIYPVLSQWASAYHKVTGNEINYQPIGSGGGLRQLYARTVDFAASDMPLQSSQLKSKDLVQFPMIVGGIVPIVNLPDIADNQLVLSGKVLSRIYMGKIKRWNAPAIAKLNPHMQLPDKTIVTVHRSDGSGTTFNFTNYLSKIDSQWAHKVGSNTVISWPGFGLGAKGNAGVASQVGQIHDAIGYVEYAYAIQNHLTVTRLKNSTGKVVTADKASFISAASHADWRHAPGFYLVLTNQPGANSWPIVATTFVLIPKHPKNSTAAAQAMKFFTWSYANGEAMTDKLDYVAIPAVVYKLIESKWSHQLPFYKTA